MLADAFLVRMVYQASMETTVCCPYCFEFVTLWLDPSDLGELVIDCEVCCRPWRVIVALVDGELVLTVERAQ